MADLSNQLSVKILNQIVRIIPALEINIKDQIAIRDEIVDALNEYEITSKSTSLVKGDLLEHAFMFLSCRRLEGMSRLTEYNYTLLFRKLDQYFPKPVSMISVTDLRLFLSTEYRNNKPNSLNAKISKLKAFFSWLHEEEYIIKNPTKMLQKVKEPYRKRTAIKIEDVELMREACETIRKKLLFEFLLSTGCRAGEVEMAEVKNIDWADNSIMVIGKGNKERKVFFSTRCKILMKQYLKERQDKGIYSPYLFVASKKPYGKLGKRSIEKDIAKIAELAEVEYHVYPHKVRHTFAQRAADQNTDPRVLQKLMGHSSFDTTMIYFNTSEENMKNEYKKIAL